MKDPTVIVIKLAGLRRTGARLSALMVCVLLSACPDPVEVSAQVNSLSIQPNPVAAPTAGTPTSFTVEWQADTHGDTYGYTFYAIAPQAASATQTLDKAIVDFGKCSTGCDPAASHRLQCTSSLSEPNPTERVVTCADPTQNQRPLTLSAGQYTAALRVYEDPNFVYHDRTFDAQAEVQLVFK